MKKYAQSKENKGHLKVYTQFANEGKNKDIFKVIHIFLVKEELNDQLQYRRKLLPQKAQNKRMYG